MKTPKEYQVNVKKGIITKEMLSACLFSANKRAKNWRDKEREYREMFRHSRWCDQYDNEEKCRTEKEKYYAQKDKMLTLLEPKCIHREYGGIRQNRVRVYDYEYEYEDILHSDQCYHTNCYWDREEQREIWFADYVESEYPVYRHYLFYDMGDHSFHTPITDVDKYPALSVVDIDTLSTFGKDVSELVSCQFVKKLLALIETGAYTLVGFGEEVACA